MAHASKNKMKKITLPKSIKNARKKNAFKYAMALFVFCAVFVAATAIKAGTENARGWPWGGSSDTAGNATGAGWISMNDLNTGAGGTYSYGVNIPASGNLTGYAWSSNLGYIDFESSAHCTTGTPSGTQYKAQSCTNPDGNTNGVSRSGGDVTGWARIVDIAKESANNNSGGWQGWIKMVNVKVSGTPPTLSGYGWNGEEAGTGGNVANGIGWIEFGKLPTVTLTANGSDVSRIDVKSSPLSQTVTLVWSSTDATSCSVDSTNNTWDSASIATSGSKIITVSSGMNEQFTVTCQGNGGEASDMASIMTLCYPQVCASQVCGNDADENIEYGVSSFNTCAAISECSSNAECETRAVEGWKEVAP